MKLSEEELSRTEIYTSVKGLKYGLIDDTGTGATTIEKAMSISYIPQCWQMADYVVHSALLT